MSRYTLSISGPNDEVLTEKIPSVTEIIGEVLAKNGLPDWYYKQAVLGFGSLLAKYGDSIKDADVRTLHSLLKTEGFSPYAVRDAAAAEGQRIHKAVEQLARGRRPTTYPALTSWWKDRGFRAKDILGTESLVYSGKNGYAGTIDLVYTEPAKLGALGVGDDLGGDTVLADVKSGNPRDSHEIQLELYRWAWEEMGRTPIDRMEIIQVPRDGSEVKVHPVEIREELTLGAAGLLQAWRWRK